MTSAAHLYRNDGHTSFADASADLLAPAGSQIALGDLDGDGDLDACFSVSTIAWNDGSGRFHDLVSNDLTWIYPGERKRVRLGDLDADGDLDAVEGIHFRNGIRNGWVDYLQPFVNEGSASFQPLSFAGSGALFFDLGDVDRDGDLDLFDGSQVFTNLTRSLAWRAPPRIGHPLVLELTGGKRAPFLLVAASATQPPRPTPFGLLQLDPSSVVFHRAGSLDGAGRSAISFDLPRDPALVGRIAYWQALIGRPPRLSNLEVTEIGGF